MFFNVNIFILVLIFIFFNSLLSITLYFYKNRVLIANTYLYSLKLSQKKPFVKFFILLHRCCTLIRRTNDIYLPTMCIKWMFNNKSQDGMLVINYEVGWFVHFSLFIKSCDILIQWLAFCVYFFMETNERVTGRWVITNFHGSQQHHENYWH